jgi:hypothetical protein
MQDGGKAPTVPVGARPNGSSYQVAINADGHCVSFSSRASNLVPDDTNDTWVRVRPNPDRLRARLTK